MSPPKATPMLLAAAVDATSALSAAAADPAAAALVPPFTGATQGKGNLLWLPLGDSITWGCGTDSAPRGAPSAATCAPRGEGTLPITRDVRAFATPVRPRGLPG